mgnify:FL=1
MGVKVRFLEQESEPQDAGPELRASIPSSALRNDNGQDYVWLVRDGVIERRAVSTDGRTAGRVGIVAGLAPGDRVVTSTGIELEEGMAVGD